MSTEIEDTNYWKDRLDSCIENKEPLHFSVYKWADIATIDEVHKGIIDKLIPKEASVLDCGCGYGRTADWFQNYTGVDFSPDFIAKAKELYPAKTFVLGSYLDIPLVGPFDWAISIGCESMITRYQGQLVWSSVLKEMKRVAKKVLILEMLDPHNYKIL